MKEILLSMLIGFGSLLGISDEASGETRTAQDLPMKQLAMEQKELPPTVAPADAEVDSTFERFTDTEFLPDQQDLSPTEQSTEEEKPQRVTDGKVEYAVPEDAPWWAPVLGGDIDSESVQKGAEGQVSTIWGNGTQGQTERTMDHPRDIQLDSKGNIYFVDGSQNTAKLRMFDGKQNKTIVDLVNNKVTRRDGFFAAAGLAIIHDNVYISSSEDIYQVEDGRITQLTPRIQNYMKEKRLENIYRIEKYKDYIYIMFLNKSRQYNIARYDTNGGAVEQVIETGPMPSPFSFYVHGDNEIFIATELGYIVWETLFPRQTKVAFEDSDPNTQISDVWIGENDDMYYAAWEDQTNAIIYDNPVGIDVNDIRIVAGDRRGFVDGFKDEVEMDKPLDFVWDGTGYIFADMGNHSIRKLWTDIGPMEK